MLNESYLREHYTLNSPASTDQVQQAQSLATIRFPQAYMDLLSLSNGLSSDGCLVLHEIEALPERNTDYDVGEYLPGYFMIGDDSGGQAILINKTAKFLK